MFNSNAFTALRRALSLRTLLLMLLSAVPLALAPVTAHAATRGATIANVNLRAGPGTLRARLTLTGAEASTPVLSTVSHVLPVGLVVNAGAQATGGRGTFSGWVSYAVEIEDAHTGTLLYAHVANRSANALDITANFGPLDAAKAGVRSAADKLDKELAGATR